jgi:hypothetical protein
MQEDPTIVVKSSLCQDHIDSTFSYFYIVKFYGAKHYYCYS